MIPDKKKTEQVHQHDIPLLDESKRSHYTESSFFSRAFIYGFFAFLVIALIWSKFAILDEVTVGDGKVIPSMQVQKIQNLEGGILTAIYVKEGDRVKKNQILLRMDNKRFAADYESARTKYLSLMASNARLLAEQTGATQISFPPEVLKDAPVLVAIENNLFQQHIQQLNVAQNTAKESYLLALKQYNITKPMVAQGLMSQLDLLKTQSMVNDLKGKIDQIEEDFQSKAHDQYNTQQTEINQLKDEMSGLADRLSRTTIHSPVYGIVNKIDISTIGGVIQPGMEIMSIVPLDDSLLIETKIRPQDIAFIHPGQKVLVKFTAYDYSIYGALEGKVEYISADAIEDPNAKASLGGQQSTTFYKILVRTNTNHLGSKAKPLPIIPGMVCTVDILTGKRSVLSYILKPILKAKAEALRER